MKRMSLIIMILAIGLFATVAIADPGPVTNTVIQDVGIGFACVEVEVEVAPAPTIFGIDLVYESTSIEYMANDEYALLSSTDINCGYIAKAKQTRSNTGKHKRVLECRSLSCT